MSGTVMRGASVTPKKDRIQEGMAHDPEVNRGFPELPAPVIGGNFLDPVF